MVDSVHITAYIHHGNSGMRVNKHRIGEYIMKRLFVFVLLLLVIPGIVFAQESANEAPVPQAQKTAQSQKDTGAYGRVNAAMEYIYSQVESWALKFDACTQDADENIEIKIQYDCKGKIQLLSNVSDCIKEVIPETFDIDITKDVCVCKEGWISFTYNKSDRITIKQKKRVGIVNTDEYCDIYRFKHSHPKIPH